MGGVEVLVVDFEVTEAHTGPVLIPLFLLPKDQGVKLLTIPQYHACLLAATLATMMKMGPTPN